MLVYVLNIDGQPLMPTRRCGWVRRAIHSGRVKIIKRCPFVVQLAYTTENKIQPVDLGIDAGSKMVGVSACTDKAELYAAEVMIRNDVVKNLATRRELRRARRNRKTRYRQARFNNRVKSKHKGWLAPSVRVKIASHIKEISDVAKILPISHITVETASFDTQKIQAIENGKTVPKGTDYQHGEMLDFWNVREYVLCRDGHICQCCKGKSKDKILNVHHIESRQTGGNAPSNLVTLCETCHKQYHQGKIKLPKTIKRSASLRDAAFMNTMRWAFYNRLKVLYPNRVSMTFGYITKNTRIHNGLIKTHAVDARCISGHPTAQPLGLYYLKRKVRCHNRQLHRMTFLKGGTRKSNQAAKEVFGYRLFDRIKFNETECFVFGRRTKGNFNIRLLDGTTLHSDISYKKLKFLEHSTTTLIERRPAL